jgi:hypothetical protein
VPPSSVEAPEEAAVVEVTGAPVEVVVVLAEATGLPHGECAAALLAVPFFAACAT